MSISFELPAAVEETLRRDHGNLDVLAKEAAVVELFRQGKISRRELETSLDLTRFEADALLKHCGVTEDLATAGGKSGTGADSAEHRGRAAFGGRVSSPATAFLFCPPDRAMLRLLDQPLKTPCCFILSDLSLCGRGRENGRRCRNRAPLQCDEAFSVSDRRNQHLQAAR